MTSFRLIAAVLLAVLFSSVHADEPFLKKGDVIALVGGEDMVAASEYGYLEVLLTRALPDYRLKFRNLAWEGDTVFEQPRQLNFPTWEEQLEKIGATVVICQFGQMESLAGKKKLPEFIAAYEKLLGRFRNGGKRRVVILEPFQYVQTVPLTPAAVRQVEAEKVRLQKDQDDLDDYATEIGRTFQESIPGLEPMPGTAPHHFIVLPTRDLGVDDALVQRDGIHLNEMGHALNAANIAMRLNVMIDMRPGAREKAEPLRKLIVAKNRLWFDYWRPQNWAFLNGDRTSQPSSRDHRDPNVRWFPAEMEQFLPLIAAKEEEIWKLAAELK